MAVPLILAGATALAGGAYAVSRPFLHRFLQSRRPEIEKWAMAKALEAAGLPDLTSQTLTRESFTKVINENFLAGSDVELSNIFDAQAIKDDLQKAALKRAAKELGLELRNATIDGMKDAIGEWVRGQVKEQIDGGGGELIDGAKDLARVLVIIRSVQKEIDENGQPSGVKPLLMTPDAISNRERQAKYRASHKRHWEEI